nr:hypothetical protein Iba_chr08aCG4900 [Ipomoea batatas]
MSLMSPLHALDPPPLVTNCSALHKLLMCSKQWSCPFMYRSTWFACKTGRSCAISSSVSPWCPALLMGW